MTPDGCLQSVVEVERQSRKKVVIRTNHLLCVYIQSWVKEWSLGCVNSRPRPEGVRRRDSRNLGTTFLPSPVYARRHSEVRETSIKQHAGLLHFLRHRPAIIPSLLFQINLIRRRTPVLLQTYLPSGLFVVVSWISFIVPPEIVPGRDNKKGKTSPQMCSGGKVKTMLNGNVNGRAVKMWKLGTLEGPCKLCGVDADTDAARG